MKDEVPKTFDWVTAHSKCSLELAFGALRDVVEADIKAAKPLQPPQVVELKMDQLTEKRFAVVRTINAGGIGIQAGVVFEQATNHIEIREAKQNGRVIFTAKPGLTGTGRCLLAIEGTPFELWQVSRRALEELFFER